MNLYDKKTLSQYFQKGQTSLENNCGRKCAAILENISTLLSDAQDIGINTSLSFHQGGDMGHTMLRNAFPAGTSVIVPVAGVLTVEQSQHLFYMATKVNAGERIVIAVSKEDFRFSKNLKADIYDTTKDVEALKKLQVWIATTAIRLKYASSHDIMSSFENAPRFKPFKK